MWPMLFGRGRKLFGLRSLSFSPLWSVRFSKLTINNREKNMIRHALYKLVFSMRQKCAEIGAKGDIGWKKPLVYDII